MQLALPCLYLLLPDILTQPPRRNLSPAPFAHDIIWQHHHATIWRVTLLFARDAGATDENACARIDLALGIGTDESHANARRARTDHRWPVATYGQLYTTGQNPAVAVGPAWAGFTATAAARNHEQQGTKNNRCGEDLTTNLLIFKDFRPSMAASSESRVSIIRRSFDRLHAHIRQRSAPGNHIRLLLPFRALEQIKMFKSYQ